MTNTAVTANMTPASNKAGQCAIAKRKFGISDIPAAMDKMKWPTSAALMRRWFNGNPWPTPDGGMDEVTKNHGKEIPQEYVDDSIVKMSWLLTFERVKKDYDYLKSMWNSPNGQKQIRAAVLKKFKDQPDGKHPLAFGSAREAEDFGYSNTVSVTMGQWRIDVLDDLRGALANFNLRVISEGDVVIVSKKIEFQVKRLGFYVEDSYDFGDGSDFISQPLGFWNFDGTVIPPEAVARNISINSNQTAMMETGALNPADVAEVFKELEGARFYLIQNSDFVEYRQCHGKGGDFRVLSDIKYETIAPTTIVISS
ncbi:hypothetical protein BK659_16215 [Pseudomonas brassicacearum]|uniref:Uncharacterized protein n=1 Tax=Pseudomonas brassicacearum TaxID=930166 RepID=A0A423H4J8_9PSED|nr:DUF6402 family protein [Pseudomonas brassicacearum]RON08106.1 hypothetical protein BK659_16215 [Pseudomonas brassicacearum]